ncbi:MAG: Glu/Leu/Phe/Val dehydrogenase [bacterium]|nr:Glu/Leu/Phe/Val dehydrogenase [bacterium]
MEILTYMTEYGYEQLIACYDRVSGLKALIALHNTTLGPALGGCRMYPYQQEDDAIVDVLRLAKGMTYKNAAAGLNLGGGKSVIIGDPRRDKTEALLRAFGRFVQTLGGRYYTAEDSGTSVEDMDVMRSETDYVMGLSTSGSSGDPSPVTAFGVWRGMKAAAGECLGDESLRGRTIALQGAGHVGFSLAQHLAEEGARLVVADVDGTKAERVAREFGAETVDPAVIHAVPCDIFSPNALGAVLNGRTIPELKCRIVAGGANNQLATEADGDELERRGIMYVPDYIINAGGVINVADEMQGQYNRDRAMKKAAAIHDNVRRVLAIARQEGIPTYLAADRLAEDRIARIGQLHQMYMPR